MSFPRVWFSTSLPNYTITPTIPRMLTALLVTGATSGIGRAAAELALSRQERVVATGRNLEPIQDLQSQYSPSQLLLLKLNVMSKQNIVEAFAKAKDAFGRVDVVLNNAAIACFGEVEGTSQDMARTIFEINFWGAANVAREAVRFFRDENPAGAGGTLLNMSSYGAMIGAGGVGYYCAAKSGKFYGKACINRCTH